MIYTPFNPPPIDFEKNTSKSLTIPDQTMSIKDMLKRHLNGIQASGREVEYDDPEGSSDDGLDNVIFTDNIQDPTDIDRLTETLFDMKTLNRENVISQKNAYHERRQKERQSAEEKRYKELKRKYEAQATNNNASEDDD